MELTENSNDYIIVISVVITVNYCKCIKSLGKTTNPTLDTYLNHTNTQKVEIRHTPELLE